MPLAPQRPLPGGSPADMLDEALEESFPASDPVAIGRSDRAGAPAGRSSSPIEWFDDLALGMRFQSRAYRVTAEAIKRFAAAFDPQPYHLDEEAAKATVLHASEAVTVFMRRAKVVPITTSRPRQAISTAYRLRFRYFDRCPAKPCVERAAGRSPVKSGISRS